LKKPLRVQRRTRTRNDLKGSFLKSGHKSIGGGEREKEDEGKESMNLRGIALQRGLISLESFNGPPQKLRSPSIRGTGGLLRHRQEIQREKGKNRERRLGRGSLSYLKYFRFGAPGSGYRETLKTKGRGIIEDFGLSRFLN